MSPDPKTWRCGHCPYSIPLPTQNREVYRDVLIRIQEHRLAHVVEALESESDADILRLCEDEPRGSEPVEAEDAAPVLAGITKLLQDDLPRARRRLR